MGTPFKGSMDKDGNWSGWAKMLQTAEMEVLDESRKMVQKAAIRLSTLVKKNITDSGQTAGEPFLPLKMETILAKGSSKPLIDSADMRNSVKATKRDTWTHFVGITGEARGNKGETVIAEYAAAHEFGVIKDAPAGKVNFTPLDRTKKPGKSMLPARPWFWPVVKKFKKELIDEMDKDFKKMFEVK